MKATIENNNLVVNGISYDLTKSIDLSGTHITSLPDGLTVGGWLDLAGTGITILPEGLRVGGWLDLRDTKITSLPEGLRVGGTIFKDF